jgi:fused signal recognition particle receptor
MKELTSKKWIRGLGKTRKGLLDRISLAFRGKSRLNEELLESLEEILIEADVGVETTLEMIDKIRNNLMRTGEISDEKVFSFLKDEMVQLFDQCPREFGSQTKPTVILVVGVNGTGKTTSIGKLAYRFRSEGKKVILACADTFRAAAGEQLSVWGDRLGVDVIRQKQGSDPASVAYDSLDSALARDMDVLIVDTAGRLHSKSNLMAELEKIHRVLGKRLASAPHETLFVLDATTGQNGLLQVQTFAKSVDITGIIITKLDGTARGGIVLAIQKATGIPVQWVGIGEGLEDMLPFDAFSFVEGLFGESQ